eukprot:403350160
MKEESKSFIINPKTKVSDNCVSNSNAVLGKRIKIGQYLQTKPNSGGNVNQMTNENLSNGSGFTSINHSFDSKLSSDNIKHTPLSSHNLLLRNQLQPSRSRKLRPMTVQSQNQEQRKYHNLSNKENEFSQEDLEAQFQIDNSMYQNTKFTGVQSGIKQKTTGLNNKAILPSIVKENLNTLEQIKPQSTLATPSQSMSKKISESISDNQANSSSGKIQRRAILRSNSNLMSKNQEEIKSAVPKSSVITKNLPVFLSEEREETLSCDQKQSISNDLKLPSPNTKSQESQNRNSNRDQSHSSSVNTSQIGQKRNRSMVVAVVKPQKTPKVQDSNQINNFNQAIVKRSETSNILKDKLKSNDVKNQQSSYNDVTFKSIQQRKHLDLGRWYCVSRPQYKKSCGISSIVAVWNYLFSKLSGNQSNSKHDIMTQEKAMEILDFKRPYEDIVFGTFTGNKAILKWFNQLCLVSGVKGRAEIIYKPNGKKNKTLEGTPQQSYERIKQGLQNPQKAYIYHCYNHYMVPVGFEEMPMSPEIAFKKDLEREQVEQLLIIADNSRKHQGFHCIKWDDIVTDLTQENPNYLDIRNLDKGIQSKNSPDYKGRLKKGKNSHCIIEFTSLNK